MGVAVATTTPATPSYAGGFIPEIWSGKLIQKFYDATVLAAIANSDYEGEIKAMGDTVHIRQVPSVTIRDYQRGQTLLTERPDAAPVDLIIDRAKYWNAECDDVAKIQSDIGMLDMWATDASEQMKIAVDGSVLNSIYADAAATNLGNTAGRISQNIQLGATGAPVALTAANVLDYIVDMGTVLDEANVPETGRFLVLPAWMAGLIKKSDIRESGVAGGDASLLRNGMLGMIDRFTLYSSNVLSATVDGANRCFRPLAGHKAGCTFAAQLTQVETLRSPTAFADIIRGLHVYGFKVVNSAALAAGYVRKG